MRMEYAVAIYVYENRFAWIRFHPVGNGTDCSALLRKGLDDRKNRAVGFSTPSQNHSNKGENMKFQDLFRTQLKLFLTENQGEEAAVFFKGFGRLQNREILSCGSLPATDGILNGDGTLNLPALEAKNQEMAQALLSRQFRIGVYEQLIAMLSAVPDLADRYGEKIIIAENNLFSGVYPAAIPAEAAKRLYDYFQDETPDLPEEIRPFLNYYGDVLSLDEEHYFTAPVRRDPGKKAETVPFFPDAPRADFRDLPDGRPVFLTDRSFPARKADLLEDRLPPETTYVVDSRTDPDAYGFGAFAGILSRMGLPFGVRTFHEFNVTDGASADQYLPLLRKYWGKDASFRKLKFYESPGAAGTVEISQGEIVTQIVSQCTAALGGNRDFNNIFITAPTGAGKSLLFQLPAIELAEKHGAVTIVITPLIALMKDQVTQLEQEHHITCATFINSTISFEEREKRIEAIKSGKKSVVYLAPELLVSTPLASITGSRPVGLFVIDEAHIVTSWGKDFRADYWYLGDFLNRLRRGGVWFPVLCLTATAVYGGQEDVVNETIASLSLEKPLIYLGSVRRDNLGFDIRHADPAEVSGSVEAFKIKKAAEAVEQFAVREEKALVYCPFVSQVDDIYNALKPETRPKVKKYYGTLEKRVRNEAQNSFREGECTVMICTKAFGMGIDVKDIRNVYHFAPTGSLADYVQEIGRAAREEGSRGCASADFLPTDIRYVKTLYSISEMKQYQLREMLRKIYDIYRERKQRGFFLSPDAFSYLFGARDLENKVKNGLLLISKDLESVYGYPVLRVRPKAMLTRSYVNVPNAAAEDFERGYGRYVKHLDDHTRRVLPSRNKRYESDTTVVNSGKIYELDMAGIWAGHFQSMSFAQFNHRFFSGDLFHCSTGEKFSPRVHIRAVYSLPFRDTLAKLKEFCTVLSDIFRKHRNQSRMFTAEEFRSDLAAGLGKEFGRLELAGLVLGLFVADLSRSIGFRSNSDRLRFLGARKAPSGKYAYRVLNSGYITMPNYFVQLASQCAPGEADTYQAYIPIGRNGRQPERLRLLALLELFGLASYQVEGGKTMEVFIRINDPVKLKELTDGRYTNGVLQDIKRRHGSALEVMRDFMARDLTSEQRWDVIENYFLGRDSDVKNALKEPESVEKGQTKSP